LHGGGLGADVPGPCRDTGCLPWGGPHCRTGINSGGATIDKIRVLVTGASGKMGREVLNAACRDGQLEPVGAVEQRPVEEFLSLPDGSGLIPMMRDIEAALVRCKPDVLVDFTTAEAAVVNAKAALSHGVAVVVGTTGLSEDNLKEIESKVKETGVGAVVAPNFALGAVLMIYLAKIAARFFDYAEVVEMHHEQKIDAPSGTAISTAKAMLEARGRPFSHPEAIKETIKGTRGGETGGIAIHSVRMPGLVASQEVIFGSLGQTLTIRHDTISRESFMPGVLMAIKEVVRRNDFVLGLDNLLGL